jgi:hypothetical protein
MDYKVKFNKCQNEHHRRGVFETWTKWAKPKPSGPRGRPASQGLGRLSPGLG